MAFSWALSFYLMPKLPVILHHWNQLREDLMQEQLQLLFFCEIGSWQSCCHVPGTAPSSLREDIKGGSPLRTDVKSCTGWAFASREPASISVIPCFLEIPVPHQKYPPCLGALASFYLQKLQLTQLYWAWSVISGKSKDWEPHGTVNEFFLTGSDGRRARQMGEMGEASGKTYLTWPVEISAVKADHPEFTERGCALLFYQRMANPQSSSWFSLQTDLTWS